MRSLTYVSNILFRRMSTTRNMIVLVIFSLLILVDSGPSISEYLTKDTEARRTCYFNPDNCFSWQTCCADGRCVNSDVGCYATCDVDSSVCEFWQTCCLVDNEWSCKDSKSDCSNGALWGIGIAAAVASIVVPIVFCCCCGGGALYWLMKRSIERRAHANKSKVFKMQQQQMMQPHQPGMQMMQGGQVQPQGYPTGGFVAPPPGHEQGNRAGEMFPSAPHPENVK